MKTLVLFYDFYSNDKPSLTGLFDYVTVGRWECCDYSSTKAAIESFKVLGKKGGYQFQLKNLIVVEEE